MDAAGALPSGGADDAADEAGALELPASHTGSQRVVTIDRARLREIGLLPPEAQERLIANQFRQIKRALLANAFGKGVPAVTNGRLMMMTSALPGEGKTFSTINLALSLAREKNIEVLMVDADVAKPQDQFIVRIREGAGAAGGALTDDRIDVESLVLRTDVNGLCILPAGRCAEDIATELLASARMDETAARLGSRYPNRIVLFDSPPLLLTNESRVLTGIAGQVVIVVRAGVTPQAAVTEAISYVGEDKPIGLVLNQSKANAPGSYYGYGAYGYGEYGRRRDGPAGARQAVARQDWRPSIASHDLRDRKGCGEPGRLDAEQVHQPWYTVTRRPVDPEVRCDLTRSRNLRANTGIGGFERPLRRPGQYTADGGVKFRGPIGNRHRSRFESIHSTSGPNRARPARSSVRCTPRPAGSGTG